ncbi:hypothetical protein ACIGHG_08530 [Bacillus sp. NPDC077411]|uniref:hypothetical protein n=1 Tax=Bacillus sp. NPDC077411 TaxID=3363947 RepID=UPI0037CAC5BA
MELIKNKQVFKDIKKQSTKISIIPDQLQVEQLQNDLIFKEHKGEYLCLYKMNDKIHFISETFGKGEVINKIEFFKVFGTEWNKRSYKMMVLNALIWYKRWLKSIFKNMEELNKQKRGLQKHHEWLMEVGEIQKASEKLLLINDINGVLKSIREQVLSIGRKVIDIVHFWDFNVNEVCVLLGGNEVEGQRLYREYQEYRQHQDTFKTFLEFALHRGLEYRHRKERMKDMYDCPYYEMPFYWAVNKVILDAIDNSPKAKENIRNFFKNEMGLTMYRTVEDLEGNILGVVKDDEN